MTGAQCPCLEWLIRSLRTGETLQLLEKKQSVNSNTGIYITLKQLEIHAQLLMGVSKIDSFNWVCYVQQLLQKEDWKCSFKKMYQLVMKTKNVFRK